MKQAASVNRSAKTLVSVTIVAWGVATAIVFHRVAPSREPPVARSPERFVSRGQVTLRNDEQAAPPLPLVRLQTAPAPQPAPADKPAIALSTLDAGSPPPQLARSFPDPNAAIASRWGAMMGLAPAARGQAGQPARTHEIVDGDTLKALARRYLGTPDRFMEIYEANRDVLPNPEVLPIGAELKIPPRQQEPPAMLTPAAPLVPVRSGEEAGDAAAQRPNP